MFARVLSTHECTKILDRTRIGHLACVEAGNQPYLVPVYFAYSDHHIYVFSMPGRKIACMRRNPNVCLHVDQHGADDKWRSVVVQGRYQELTNSLERRHERDHAWRVLSRMPNWWEPGSLKPVEETRSELSDHYDHVFFRILINEVSGREGELKHKID